MANLRRQRVLEQRGCERDLPVSRVREDRGRRYTRLVFSAARLLNNTPVFTLMRLLVSAALVALTASFASFPSPSRLGPCDLEAVATDATTRPVSIAAARALSARSS